MVALALALALAPLTAAGADDGAPAATATLADVRALDTACPPAVTRCFGLVLHVAPGMDGGLVQSPRWIAGQLASANRLFAPLAVGFTLVEVRALGAREVVVWTRADRNRLQRLLRGRGHIDVFVVGRLGDVDRPGEEINGVHWRRNGRRWIILAAKAWDLTLGHELGHYFGLPHSAVAASIMNTTRRAHPPHGERLFQPDELARMRRTIERAVRRRTLRDHARPATGR